MIGLVSAELYRARHTRSLWAVAVVGVLACMAWTLAHVLAFMAPGATATDVEGAYSMAQQGYVFAMIIGIVVVAGEFRHRTYTWSLLITPRRGRVIAGKLIASAVLGLVLGLAAVAVTGPAAAILLATQGYQVGTSGVPLVLAGSAASTTLWCVFGAALGALIGNQIVAIGACFVWFFYAEWFLLMLVSEVGRWTPTGLGKAVSGWVPDGDALSGDLLPAGVAGLVFLAYTVVASLLARMVTLRRDIA